MSKLILVIAAATVVQAQPPDADAIKRTANAIHVKTVDAGHGFDDLTSQRP